MQIATDDGIPTKFALHQNYPNPFNPGTNINYELPITSFVELSIYTTMGKKVVTLVSEKQQAGYYKIEWNASELASGVYYYRMRSSSGFTKSKKLILLR